MRWRLILEEYGPMLEYIKGETNVVADALSRLAMVKEPNQDPTTQAESDAQSCELFARQEFERNFPKDFPLTYEEIAHEQQRDADLQELLRQANSGYSQHQFPNCRHGYELITKDNKIVLPKSMQAKAIK